MSTPLPNDISLNGLNTIRSQEGRALRAYQDAVHVWTIGYGLTNYDKGLPWRIQRGLVISENQAEWFLIKSIRENYLPDVLRALRGGTYQHPQGAVDGGSDFHFNCGGILKATWPRLLGSGQLAAAERSMKSWCKAGGRVLADLVRRRATDWNIVSAESYGRISGPLNVVPNAAGRESYHGYGDLLTAFPTPNGTAITPPPVAKGPSGMPPAPPTTPNPGVLKAGSTGPEVTEAQQKLAAAGYPVPVTGVFDDATVAATTQFQQAHPNLTADGEIGPATDAGLDRAANLRKTTTTVVKTAAPAVPSAYIGFHEWVSAHAGNIALGVGVAAVVAVMAVVAWRYRHDIAAVINKWTGTTLP